MPTVNRNAHVRYTAEQMFDLVRDIERYPEFLHWCRGACIEQRERSSVIAAVDIGFAGMHKTFKTRNRLIPPAQNGSGRIDIELVSGPFRHLQGHWSFHDTEAGAEGSDVGLLLEYELTTSPLSLLFAAVFEEVARSQMDAFVNRAEEVYASV